MSPEPDQMPPGGSDQHIYHQQTDVPEHPARLKGYRWLCRGIISFGCITAALLFGRKFELERYLCDSSDGGGTLWRGSWSYGEALFARSRKRRQEQAGCMPNTVNRAGNVGCSVGGGINFGPSGSAAADRQGRRTSRHDIAELFLSSRSESGHGIAELFSPLQHGSKSRKSIDDDDKGRGSNGSKSGKLTKSTKSTTKRGKKSGKRGRKKEPTCDNVDPNDFGTCGEFLGWLPAEGGICEEIIGCSDTTLADIVFFSSRPKCSKKCERSLTREQTKFLGNKSKWNRRGTDNYDYTWQELSECLPGEAQKRMSVSVRNGKKVSITYVDDDKMVPDEFAETVQDVDELFKSIEATINSVRSEIGVVYNRKWGHPEKVSVDGDCFAETGENNIFIRDVSPMPPSGTPSPKQAHVEHECGINPLLAPDNSLDWSGKPYEERIFCEELPIPEIKSRLGVVNTALMNPTSPCDYTDQETIPFYEITVKEFNQTICWNISLSDGQPTNCLNATQFGYDGGFPGNTIVTQKGERIVVRLRNELTEESARVGGTVYTSDQYNPAFKRSGNPLSMHLHGSATSAPWDGWAEDVTFPGQYKDYMFPNYQTPRTIWYHDHSIGITGVNEYFGCAGAWLILDPKEDVLRLPGIRTEPKNDVPLVLQTKFYQDNGMLLSPVLERDSFYGDVQHVNGVPYPHLHVKPQRYRFRTLNGGISRTFHLYLESERDPDFPNLVRDKIPAHAIPFSVIASDTTLLDKVVTTTSLYSSMSERYEIVIDFTCFAGEKIIMRNRQRVGKAIDHPRTDVVMQFIVDLEIPPDETDESDIRSGPYIPTGIPNPRRSTCFGNNNAEALQLATHPNLSADHQKPPIDDRIINILDDPEEITDHVFMFDKSGPGDEFSINGVVFSDVRNRILANPTRGQVEIWQLENVSDDWSHPVHVHLVDFQVLRREGGRRFGELDDNGLLEYEKLGLKDTVWLGRNEIVWVAAYYQPHPGAYMFHCHNLIHEDHDMMAVFNVTWLEDFGYNFKDDIFIDPMEPMWRAVPNQAGGDTLGRDKYKHDIAGAIEDLICPYKPYFQELKLVEERLADYWGESGVDTSEPHNPAFERYKVENPD